MRHHIHHIDPFETAIGERYKLVRELGRGGMAAVYLAQDTKHNRPVAIKILRPEIASGIGSARFLREIRITSSFTHPNLLSLHDSGEVDGILYYVMPYLDGETLRARLDREKQLSLDEAMRIFADAADGLGCAHRHNVVHRDLKPENILLHEGRAIVVDFGIARALTASAADSLTSSGLVIGTVSYMSPEQGSGAHELDARTDVYALACVLYEMLAGEPPFTGPNPQAVIARHISEPVPSLRVVRPDVPPAMEQAIRRGLAKTPPERHPSTAAFVEAVSAARTPQSEATIGAEAQRGEPRPLRAFILIAGIILALAALIFASTWGLGASAPDDGRGSGSDPGQQDLPAEAPAIRT